MIMMMIIKKNHPKKIRMGKKKGNYLVFGLPTL